METDLTDIEAGNQIDFGYHKTKKTRLGNLLYLGYGTVMNIQGNIIFMCHAYAICSTTHYKANIIKKLKTREWKKIKIL